MIDLAYFDETLVKGKDAKVCLVIIDVYSKMIIAKPLLNSTYREVANAMEEVTSLFGVPKTLLADNGAQLTSNHELQRLIDKYKIKELCQYRTLSPHKDSNVYAENSVRVLRNALILNSKSYKRPMSEVFKLSVYAINNRHLTYLSYTDENGVKIIPTPFFLFFDKMPGHHLGRDVFEILSESEDIIHKAEWQDVMRKYDEEEQCRLELMKATERPSFKPEIGSLVLVIKHPINEHGYKFMQDLFEVIDVGAHSTVTVKPYLHDGLTREVSLDHIKINRFHELYKFLPEKITYLLMRPYTPDEMLQRLARKEMLEFLGEDEPEVIEYALINKVSKSIAARDEAKSEWASNATEDLITATSSLGTSTIRNHQTLSRSRSI